MARDRFPRKLRGQRSGRIGIVLALALPVAGGPTLALRGDDFVPAWLILGPHVHAAGFTPSERQIRRDYLTDGDITQESMSPAEVGEIATDYGGSAASTGLAPTPDRPGINPRGIPAWFYHDAEGETIDFEEVFGETWKDVVAHAFVYLSAGSHFQEFEIASAGAVQILLDGREIYLLSPPEGKAGGLADGVTLGVWIEEGCNQRFLVKVFAGEEGHAFRLRWVPAGPVTETGRLADCDRPWGFRRGDADGSGRIDIKDPISFINYLFQGFEPTLCLDAADADDNGDINLTDAVALLNWLFGGAPPPPAPGPEVCGHDPTADGLPFCFNEGC